VEALRAAASAGMTARDLGAELDVHHTTVRFHAERLASEGVLSSRFVRSGRSGRPAKVYRLVGDHAAPGPDELLGALLNDDATDGSSPQQAGRRWVASRGGLEASDAAATVGQWAGKIGALVDLLSEWGYTADWSLDGVEGDVELLLHECPFLAEANDAPEVVCGLHQGLLAGALEQSGETRADVTLERLIAPRTCRARLVRHGAGVSRLVL